MKKCDESWGKLFAWSKFLFWYIIPSRKAQATFLAKWLLFIFQTILFLSKNPKSSFRGQTLNIIILSVAIVKLSAIHPRTEVPGVEAQRHGTELSDFLGVNIWHCVILDKFLLQFAPLYSEVTGGQEAEPTHSGGHLEITRHVFIDTRQKVLPPGHIKHLQVPFTSWWDHTLLPLPGSAPLFFASIASPYITLKTQSRSRLLPSPSIFALSAPEYNLLIWTSVLLPHWEFLKGRNWIL